MGYAGMFEPLLILVVCARVVRAYFFVVTNTHKSHTLGFPYLYGLSDGPMHFSLAPFLYNFRGSLKVASYKAGWDIDTL